MTVLPTTDEVRARVVRVGRDGLTLRERLVWLVLYGNPLDTLEALAEVLRDEGLALIEEEMLASGPPPRPCGQVKGGTAKRGEVTVGMAALGFLLDVGRWACTREVTEAVLAADGVAADVSTTTVSVALQKLAARGAIAKGVHPDNMRLARWHHDVAAPASYDPCPMCGRGDGGDDR